MLKHTIPAALAASLTLTAPSSSAAAARQPACATARVGLSDLGYASYQEHGAYRGIAVDVVAEIRKRTGCQFRFEWYPRGRLFALFNSDQLEITAASVRTAERDRYGNWLPYATTQFELLLLNGQVGDFNSLADFIEHSKARLNVTRGVSYPPELVAQMERLHQLGRLEYVDDYSVVFKKILAGRAEGTLAPPAIHVLYVQQLHLDGRMTRLPVTESPQVLTGMYLSKKLVPGKTVSLYAGALRAMVADGTVQKIYARYLGENIAREIFMGGGRAVLEALPRP